MPNIRSFYNNCRIPGGTQNNVLQRHTHIQELGHHITHIFHATIHTFSMEVGADHIRPEALLHGRYCLPPRESPTAMPHIKNNSSLLSLENKRLNLPIVINNRFSHRRSKGERVRKNISRPEMLHKQCLYGIWGLMFTKINHHRNISDFASLHGAIYLRKIAPEMRGFNTNNNIWKQSLNHISSLHRVHIIYVLFFKAA